MRKYELILILNPKMGEEEVDKNIDALQKVITSQKGEVAEIDKWGVREMATVYKKTKTGFHVMIKFSAAPEALKKLYASLKVNEQVVNYMVSHELIKKEKVAAKES